MILFSLWDPVTGIVTFTGSAVNQSQVEQMANEAGGMNVYLGEVPTGWIHPVVKEPAELKSLNLPTAELRAVGQPWVPDVPPRTKVYKSGTLVGETVTIGDNSLSFSFPGVYVITFEPPIGFAKADVIVTVTE